MDRSSKSNTLAESLHCVGQVRAQPQQSYENHLHILACLVGQESGDTGLGRWLTTHAVLPFHLRGAAGRSHRTLVDVLPQFIERKEWPHLCVLLLCPEKPLCACGDHGSSALLIGISQRVLSDL